MASPFYFILEGTFQIIGKEPDGDSVRFAALNPDDWGKLHRSFRIKPSPTDGTVQLRFEGIDAPETHYGSDAQPLGDAARDALLKAIVDVRFIEKT